jgi:THUMP domain-containing protein/RNA cap guanine-N2 methyltransferase
MREPYPARRHAAATAAATDHTWCVAELLDDPVRAIEALSSPPGRRLLDRLAGEQPGQPLRLTTELRRDYPPELVRAALTQHELRVAARTKFSRAAEMFFTRAGLEQASSERAARHRARRYAGSRALADLCCGIGGDLIALAGGHRVLAVDRDPLHAAIAAHNAAVYGVGGDLTTVVAEVREVDLSGIDAAFIDPARRSGDRRLRPGTSEPPLRWCLGLAARVAAVGIKAAPGIPREAVPEGWEAEFVADGRALKEALLWSPALAEHPRRATILPDGHTLVPAPGPAVRIAPPGAYLLDPSPAVTRAGLVEELARGLGAWKIDPEIAFLSTDALRSTPFARTLRIVHSAPWNERQFAQRLRALDIGAVDIRRRGLAGDVALIHRRLRLRGNRRATVVITRVSNRPWGLICVEPG